jgi:UDP-hydrolysing UDP-N-acetyl-D-glucosamine 2-epimerase
MRFKNIFVVSSSRADYGCLFWVIKELKDRKIKYKSLIINPDENQSYYKSMYIHVNTYASSYGIAKGMIEITKVFSTIFESNNIDLLIVLGDRWEIMTIVNLALLFQIPIAHIGGGEVSHGSLDQYYRNCISIMSDFHFVISEQCKQRLNEIRIYKNIFVVGSPRLDYLRNLQVKKLYFNNKTALVIFHPETINRDDSHIDTLLRVLNKIELDYIFLNPNQDIGAEYIREQLKKFCEQNKKNTHLLENQSIEKYLEILSGVDLVIGNSSAGLIEAPVFKLPVVNVGDRQKGRDRLANVIDVSYNVTEIKAAVKKALGHRFKAKCKKIKENYGDGYASKKIVDILEVI